jgi:hypothetical protein
MKYYRVKKEYHDKKVNCISLVQNELLTAHEKNFYRVPDCCVEEVEVKKTETYFCFGARFSKDCGYSD